MKAYTMAGGRLERGIEVKETKEGWGFEMGEKGRERTYEWVALSKENPPETTVKAVESRYKRVLECSVAEMPRPSGSSYYVIEKEDGPVARFLVLIRTNSGYRRNVHGVVGKRGGNPITLLSRRGAFGIAGGCGSYRVELVVLHPGDILYVGNTLGPALALWADEVGIHTMPWTEYQARQSLAG